MHNIVGQPWVSAYSEDGAVVCTTDTATLLYIKQHSLVLEADAIMKSWRAAVGSWSFPVLQKSYWLLLYRRDRERSPKIDVKCVITATFGHYIWKAIPQEASQRESPNLELKLWRDCSIDWIPRPLPVIYIYSWKHIRLYCHPNIDYLPYYIKVSGVCKHLSFNFEWSHRET